MPLKFITLYLILQHFLVDAKVSIGVKVVVFAVKDNLVLHIQNCGARDAPIIRELSRVVHYLVISSDFRSFSFSTSSTTGSTTFVRGYQDQTLILRNWILDAI